MSYGSGLSEDTVYETTREVDTAYINIPVGTLLRYDGLRGFEEDGYFTVYDGQFRGAEIQWIWPEDLVELAGLVEVVF